MEVVKFMKLSFFPFILLFTNLTVPHKCLDTKGKFNLTDCSIEFCYDVVL